MKTGRVFALLVIGFVFVYLICGMARFGEGSTDRAVESVTRVLDRALVQCYALEGAYPVNLERVGEYGVLFDHDRYHYVYEYIAANVKPSLIVLEK